MQDLPSHGKLTIPDRLGFFTTSFPIPRASKVITYLVIYTDGFMDLFINHCICVLMLLSFREFLQNGILLFDLP